MGRADGPGRFAHRSGVTPGLLASRPFPQRAIACTVRPSVIDCPAPAHRPQAPSERDLAIVNKPTRDETERAVRTLLEWIGDDPDREGLRQTPARVAKAFEDWYSGYREDPVEFLRRTFYEVDGYDEMVVLRDISFVSHCEHHMAPITGKASIAYLPKDRVVGISKLARVLHGFASRLQVQERLTAQVADCIWERLRPQGVAVVIEATHGCMTARGVRTPGVGMVTSRMMGVFRDDERSRQEVLKLMGY